MEIGPGCALKIGDTLPVKTAQRGGAGLVNEIYGLGCPATLAATESSGLRYASMILGYD